MAKRKKYRFRCPVCGLLVWENRLINQYPLELVDVYSSGRGKITNVFFEWDTGNSLQHVFEERFYDVLKYLLKHGYVDANVVKNIVSFFDAPCLRPVHVHVPVHVHKPLHVHDPKMR